LALATNRQFLPSVWIFQIHDMSAYFYQFTSYVNPLVVVY
jgi:hypothetical protein